MGTIRRTFGGFVVAVVIAAGLVLMPAPIHAARGGHSTSGSGGDSYSFCTTLDAAIQYIYATYDGDLETALVAPFLFVWESYCKPSL